MMEYEEFRETCPMKNAREDCRILTNPANGRLLPCTSDPSLCPLWFLRESILKEINGGMFNEMFKDALDKDWRDRADEVNDD